MFGHTLWDIVDVQHHAESCVSELNPMVQASCYRLHEKIGPVVESPGHRSRARRQVLRARYFPILQVDDWGNPCPSAENDWGEFVEAQKTTADPDKIWAVAVNVLNPSTFTISGKPPNVKVEVKLPQPQAIMQEKQASNEEISVKFNIINSYIYR